MNKTKKILILLAAIFSFVDVGLGIYDIVSYFRLAPAQRGPVFYVIFSFVEIFASIAVAVLLVLSIWKNGSMFRAR